MAINGQAGQAAMPPPLEIITLTNAGFSYVKMPNSPDGIILMFTLANGRQYQIPLDGRGRQLVAKALNQVSVYGPDDVPGRQ